MLGSSWRCSGSPPALCCSAHIRPVDCLCLPKAMLAEARRAVPSTSGCHAHLAASPAAGTRARSRTSGCKLSTATALGYWFRNLAEQYKSSKITQGSGFGVFLLVCQQAGICRREAAHFQGLCEQEGQLLEFEAASSTVNSFLLCYLWLGRAGEHLGSLIFLLQYV